jgi:uncharacterized protein (DUF1015 family)
MATVRAFRALRPIPEKARDIASVPYDVVSTEEAQVLAEGNPLSFLHVIRPEIYLPRGTNPYEDIVYHKAAENLSHLLDKGVLIEEREPCLYGYRIRVGEHEQTGLACCCSVEEYDHDIIKKHEHTRKEKEDDRLRHMLTLSAYTGPVLMTYRKDRTIWSLIEKYIQGEPLYDFTAPDGVRHTLWRIIETEEIKKAFQEVPYFYIADGHHRAAGASRVREEILKKNPQTHGDEEFNFFLAVLFPSNQLKILPYNRWVSSLKGMSDEEFLRQVKLQFVVTESSFARPTQKGQFCMYLRKKWYCLTLKHTEFAKTTDPVAALDLSIFQHHLLEPVLGIMNQRNDKRIDFIGGEESTDKLVRRVNEKGGVAFSFLPVSVDELLAVADAHRIMPPKSTWFSPKLRSGLLIHRF